MVGSNQYFVNYGVHSAVNMLQEISDPFKKHSGNSVHAKGEKSPRKGLDGFFKNFGMLFRSFIRNIRLFFT
jgi:hypothetical protein